MGTAASFKYNAASRSVGASGAIFGLVGAYSYFLARHEHVLGDQASAIMGSLLRVVALNLATGLIPGSGVDNAGHAGGLIGGVLAGFIIGPHLVLSREPAWLGARGWYADRSLWGRAVHWCSTKRASRTQRQYPQLTPYAAVVSRGRDRVH
mmetsp:Transcript_24529/g.63335  ORF Transcript_24529/g.63335 Transcript_24529/m.63335 type:complete len:151 (-) Transcript_24529:9-461(-)